MLVKGIKTFLKKKKTSENIVANAMNAISYNAKK